MIWFTADQHFGHSNILRYCNRPFSTVAEMDRHIIREYNACVNPDDICYFLGDLTLGGESHVRKIINSLNGRKVLILGNHDRLKPFTYVDIGFESVHTALQVEEFILTHDPACSAVDTKRLWLCGHIHGLFLKQNNVLNVGVDVWNYRPVSYDTVQAMFDQL